MATINLGRVKPVFRGAYDASTSYVIDDIVTYQNETYIAITATTGNLPTVTANWTKLAAKGTDGTDISTTLTTQGDLLYRDGSGLQRLAAGTSGQVLQTGGSGANPSWTDLSSDYVLLATQDITSNVSSVSFDGYFSSTYKNYQIRYSDVSPASNGVNFRMRVRQSNADVTSNDYYYAFEGVYRQLTTGDAEFKGGGNGTDGAINYNQALSDNGSFNTNGVFEIYNPLSSAYRIFRADTVYYDTNTDYMAETSNVIAFRANTSALSGISFFMSSGSIQSGTFKLYGIK
jgi:hypothetical protein